jgi:Ca-activated chloride channel family protein
MPDPSALLEWLKEQGIEFRLPALLWALAAVPALLLFYVGARRSRRDVVRAFHVTGYRPRRTVRGLFRAVALALVWLGLSGTAVGFARPVVELPTPEDRATVIVVVDASLAMRATDVKPTRLDAAKGSVRALIGGLPERVQVGLVAYSAAGYFVQAPTHDHGAVPAALGRLRTADGAALGDALLVALAAIPAAERGAGGLPPVSGSGGGGQGASPKVPAAVVLLATGDLTGGRDVAEAASVLREAGVPVHVVPVGPRPGAEQKATYNEQPLRLVSATTGGRVVAGGGGSASEWRQLLRGLGSEVKVEVQPQEVGQFVGGGGLAVMGVGMVVMLIATRRLI